MKVVNKTYIYFSGLLNFLALQHVHDTFQFFHSFQILFEKKETVVCQFTMKECSDSHLKSRTRVRFTQTGCYALIPFKIQMFIVRELIKKGNNIPFVFLQIICFPLLTKSHYRVLVINFYFLTDKRTNSSSNVQPCIEICFSIILLHVQPYSAKIPAHHKTVQEVEVLFSSTARSCLSSAIKDSYFSGLTSEAARKVENGRAFNLTASVNDEL